MTTTFDAREAAVPRLTTPDSHHHLDVLGARAVSVPRAVAAGRVRPVLVCRDDDEGRAKE